MFRYRVRYRVRVPVACDAGYTGGDAMAGLTPKQAIFVDEYLKDLNATQACIRAGYSEKTAEQQGPRLLGNVGVAEAIAVGMEKRAKRTQIGADYVLNRLAQIDQLDVADILDNTGNFKPVLEWPKVWRQTVSGLDIQEIMSGDTESVIRKIKWPDKLRNLELLGKHVDIGAFRERIDMTINVSLADKLAKARERITRR